MKSALFHFLVAALVLAALAFALASLTRALRSSPPHGLAAVGAFSACHAVKIPAGGVSPARRVNLSGRFRFVVPGRAVFAGAKSDAGANHALSCRPASLC